MSHPPHLKTALSSALIPFCAFKTNLDFSQNSFAPQGISFPLCSSFLPTILEGQLCYNLKLNKTRLSGQGKENELMMLLEYNEDRSLQVSSDRRDAVKSSHKTLNFNTAVESIQGVSAKIQINTLSPFVGFGGGLYVMSVVKRMTAKEDFLQMPLYEDCRTMKLMQRCNCVPWELSGYQVMASNAILWPTSS